MDYIPQLNGLSRTAATDFARNYPWKDWLLVYRAGWYRDPMTGIRERCVDARCSRCGRTMKLPRYDGRCGSGESPFGFWSDEENRGRGCGDRTACPNCGKKVIAAHVSCAPSYARSWSWVMEPHRFTRGAGERDALGLMLWRVRRWFDKDARARIETEPYECYIVEDEQIIRYKHWHKMFYSTFCAGVSWERSARLIDTMYDIDIAEVCGDVAAALPGTTAENSKLDLYLRQDETTFPVSYLRLWQRHPNVETLLTCGAGGLLGAMIEREKKRQASGDYYRKYGKGLVQLRDADWTAKRPNEILRMDRGEWRERQKLTPECVELLLMHRKYGVAIKAEETGYLKHFALLLERDRDEYRRLLSFGERLDKAERYLEAQKRRFPKDTCSMSFLADYWDMAKKVGWDVRDRGLLYPAHLGRAHDQALQQMQFKEDEKLRALFAARARELERYRFAWHGLEIVPPARENDLIIEGKALDHCVATYAERHAKGKTVILFIRRCNEPEIPYFTLNISPDGQREIQNHGLKNCGPTSEVEKFTELFMAWSRAGCPRDKNGEPVLAKKKARGAA